MELLTTITVGSLLASIAVPSMTSVIRGNQVVAYTNDLVASVYAARGEAMNEVVQVAVCKSSNQAACDNTVSWEDGWIVFIDNDADSVRDVGETLVYAHESLKGAYTLQSAAFDNWIAFRPNGLAIGSTANAGTFSLCHETGSYGRDISISRTGSPSVDENAEGSCP